MQNSCHDDRLLLCGCYSVLMVARVLLCGFYSVLLVARVLLFVATVFWWLLGCLGGY